MAQITHLAEILTISVLALTACSGSPPFEANSTVAANDTAHPYKWACRSFVRGPRGSAASVLFMIKPDGQIGERDVDWTPPRIADESDGNPSNNHLPQLLIEYHAAGRDRLGNPIMVYISVGNDPSTSLPDAAIGTLKLDQGASWATDFDKAPGGGGYWSKSRGIAFNGDRLPRHNVDLLSAINQAHLAEVKFQGRNGELLGLSHFDVSANSHRSCLIEAAWQATESASEHPRADRSPCSPAYGMIDRLITPAPPVNC